MQNRSSCDRVSGGLGSQSYSGRRGLPTCERPYIGRSEEAAGLEEKLHLCPGVVAKFSHAASEQEVGASARLRTQASGSRCPSQTEDRLGGEMGPWRGTAE